MFRVLEGPVYWNASTTSDIGDYVNFFGPNAAYAHWMQQQKALLTQAFSDWIAPTMNSVPVPYQPGGVSECEAFVGWLENVGRLQLFVVAEQLSKMRHLDSRAQTAAIGKAVEGLATTVEHILNDITAANPPPAWPGWMLFRKFLWLWSSEPSVHAALQANRGLVNTKPGFAKQKAAIRALATGGPYDGVVRDLLETVLVRNAGSHLGFIGLNPKELHDEVAVILRTTVLIWKHARIRGLL